MIAFLRYLFILIAFANISFSNSIKEFLEREAFVVDVINDKVIIDLGEGRVREGEIFKAIEPADKVVHPWTGETLGVFYRVKGKLIVTKVYKRFSEGRIVEGSVNKGDRLKVLIKEICYSGSTEGFFEVGVLINNIKRGEECPYIIRELKNGFGLEFEGKPLAYMKTSTFPKSESIKQLSTKPFKEETKKDKKHISKLLLKPMLIGTFSDIPISADVGDIYGDGKEYLIILFEDRIEIFELHEKDILKKDTVFLPAGNPAFIKVARIDPSENKDYILLNMVEGDEAKSYIIKIVKDEPVFIVKDIPFFINVLNKKNPTDSFVGQKVKLPKWGKVFKVKFSDGNIESLGTFIEEEGVAIDGAILYKNTVYYIDISGGLNILKDGLRVFKGSINLRSSYNYVEFGEDEDDKDIFFFANPISMFRIGETDLLLTAFNERSKASELFNIPLFKRGYVFFGNLQEEDLILKKALSDEMKQTVQAILMTDKGDLFIVTAFKGTLQLSKGGNIYKVSVSASFD